MTNKVTLDQIRADAEKKYGACEIEAGDKTFVLKNMLRLDRETRKEVHQLLKEMGSQGEENLDLDNTEDTLDKVITLLGAKELLDMEGVDLSIKLDILTKWQGDTQVGEASPSPS